MPEYFHKIIFRPTPAPATETPLGARSAGHYRLRGDWREQPLRKQFVQVFWGVAGEGEIVIGGAARRLTPGRVAIYLPGMEHDLRGTGAAWEYRWWTMDGPLAVSAAAAFGLGAGVFEAGPAPETQLEELFALIARPSRENELAAGALAYRLLALAAAGVKRPQAGDAAVGQALELFHAEWNDPRLGVETAAARLRVHRSSLCRRFTAEVGVSPIKYIRNLRLQQALALLRTGRLTVREVARRCGFNTPNYLARVMRESYGQTPEEFRRRG